MFFATGMMYSSFSSPVDNGKADLSHIDFTRNQLVQLNGQWEFYWNKLLTPEDFTAKQPPQIDSPMKVPGTWSNSKARGVGYPNHGVATYRLHLNYPSALKDPALRIQHVATAYMLYVNGRLAAEVGKVSDNPLNFREGEKLIILDLPRDSQELELIFQVANLNYSGGGLMLSPVFGSKKLLERQRIMILAQQLFFIGSVFIFGVYYFLLFLLRTKNKTALLFSMLCLITALRSLIWGEPPLTIFFPDVAFDVCLFINYLTGYNVIPIIILFILSIYPLEYKKRISGLVLLPTLFFDALLLKPPAFMSIFTNYLYILILVQLIFAISILIKAVLHKRDNSIVMFAAICIFNLTVIQDILYYKGIGGINLSYMFLYGSLAFITAMSYVQAKQQANAHQKLILYNENLVEADRLKDKIMATEMSFLQAQIKPHFLYNALNAIANICERDEKKAGGLILDLAIYLRGSLEFNNLNKMVTVEKELEFVDTYFNIEQARFGEKIHLLKEIEIALDFQIPVLILQPLVENAVRHGISKKPGGGTVYVRMKQTHEGASIEIEDDGVGMDGEKLATLLNKEKIEQGRRSH